MNLPVQCRRHVNAWIAWPGKTDGSRRRKDVLAVDAEGFKVGSVGMHVPSFAAMLPLKRRAQADMQPDHMETL